MDWAGEVLRSSPCCPLTGTERAGQGTGHWVPRVHCPKAVIGPPGQQPRHRGALHSPARRQQGGFTSALRAAASALTFHILHHHAQVPPGLKGTKHADHEGVLGESQDVPLHKHLLDLVPENQVLLVNFLYGKALAGLFVPHQIHRPAREKDRQRLLEQQPSAPATSALRGHRRIQTEPCGRCHMHASRAAGRSTPNALLQTAPIYHPEHTLRTPSRPPRLPKHLLLTNRAPCSPWHHLQLGQVNGALPSMLPARPALPSSITAARWELLPKWQAGLGLEERAGRH